MKKKRVIADNPWVVGTRYHVITPRLEFTAILLDVMKQELVFQKTEYEDVGSFGSQVAVKTQSRFHVHRAQVSLAEEVPVASSR